MSENQPTKSGRVPRSQQLYRRALELIPGGTQLISRRPTRFANGVSPASANKAGTLARPIRCSDRRLMTVKDRDMGEGLLGGVGEGVS
jgi:hypothetical protein